MRNGGETIRKEIVSRVSNLYKWLDEQITAQNSVAGACVLCGKCCDFASFGHRLFVTTPEMIFFAEKIGIRTFKYSVEGSDCHFDRSDAVRRGVEKSIKKDSSTSLRGVYPEQSRRARNDIEMPTGRCSCQVDGKCSVYQHRFAGCRIFCCKGDAAFQSDLSEAVIKKFKALCDEFQIPYRYVDLPTALKNYSPLHT